MQNKNQNDDGTETLYNDYSQHTHLCLCLSSGIFVHQTSDVYLCSTKLFVAILRHQLIHCLADTQLPIVLHVITLVQIPALIVTLISTSGHSFHVTCHL